VPLSYTSILKSAVIAGIIAALALAAFNYVFTEPVIEQAIALEKLTEGSMEPEVVSREVQRGPGALVGFLMYGVTWALLYSVVFQLSRGYFPGASLRRRSLVLAAGALWAVCLLPFLKYPANPPGVGEADTIGYRQALYVGMLVLSIAGTVVAAIVASFAARRASQSWAPWVAGLGFLAVYSLVMCLVMPNNPDPITAPMWLVDQFRERSAIGLVLFWAVMGPAFAFFASRAAQPRRVPIPRPI
jgi:predicted cobalt transporter CbtA